MESGNEQYARVLELLRTRNLGGGQQGVMEWTDGSSRGSEIPVSGDAFLQAFGSGPADGEYRLSREARSRRALEWAIECLRDYDVKAYLAVRQVFDADVGGYRDLEWFEETYPLVAEYAKRGVWLLTARLLEVPLYVEAASPMTKREEELQHARNAGVYTAWTEGKAAGMRSKDLVDQIRDVYGISERRVYQIIEQETPEQDERPKRGRPRKGAKNG